MDEIFERNNFISLIAYRTKSPLGSNRLSKVSDYIIWFSKNKSYCKFNPLFMSKDIGEGTSFTWVEETNGQRRRMTREERKDVFKIPNGGRVFTTSDLVSSGSTQSCIFDFEIDGVKYSPFKGRSWKTNKNGIKTLISKNRIIVNGNTPRFVFYYDDYPVQRLHNIWMDMQGVTGKKYIVETNPIAIQRCLLMTTDPGDIVFDPTCGSGTTAYVAEKWGRRWITCDTSRVAITLAKQRLMTSVFDYYELKNKDEGISSGFQYKTVPHITLGSIANNELSKKEVLYDQPLKDNKKARVTGPFTVEAVPSQFVQAIGREKKYSFKYEWLDEVRKTGIRGKKGVATDMDFARLEKLSGFKYLHAEGETKNPRSVIISFGPEHSPLDKRQVELALKEVEEKKEKPDILAFASFHFDPEAFRLINEQSSEKLKMIPVQMNMDLQTSDLKKKASSNESFWLIGSPDVEIKNGVGSNKNEYTVEVHGWDYYNPSSGKIESGGKDRIAMWILDTDYDDRAIFPRQVFFPMAGKSDGWTKLAKSLKSEIDESLIEEYRGTQSLPFKKRKNDKIAVKIIDDRGIESLKIFNFPKQKSKAA